MDQEARSEASQSDDQDFRRLIAQKKKVPNGDGGGIRLFLASLRRSRVLDLLDNSAVLFSAAGLCLVLAAVSFLLIQRYYAQTDVSADGGAATSWESVAQPSSLAEIAEE